MFTCVDNFAGFHSFVSKVRRTDQSLPYRDLSGNLISETKLIQRTGRLLTAIRQHYIALIIIL